MNRASRGRIVPIASAAIGLLGVAVVVLLTTSQARTQSAGSAGIGTPAFLQADRCYRLTFPIAGVPQWKVVEVLDGGWVRAEADAGPVSGRRDAAWINTAQVVTVREARCSG